MHIYALERKVGQGFLIFLLVWISFASAEGADYDSKGKRDPFVPLIGIEKAGHTALSKVISIEDVSLEGIAVGPQSKGIAILNGEMVKEGDRIGSLEIIKISYRAVTISIGGTEYNIGLPEEGGVKGEL